MRNEIPPATRLALFAAILCGLAFEPAFARLGETRLELERRLLASGLAAVYDDARAETKLSDRSLAYRHLADLFPEGCEHVFYYKTDGEQPDPNAMELPPSKRERDNEVYPPGWDLHVVYLNGKSVFEAYRRNDGNLVEDQVAAVLALNSAGGEWKPVENRERTGALGVHYESQDGSVRAARMGNTLVVFLAELDATLKARMAELAREQTEGF